MENKQLSIKVILDKIMRHPLLEDLSIETIVDYTVDFMRLVGAPAIFEEKTLFLPIVSYRCALPEDFYQMTQVRLLDNNLNVINTFRHSTDTFHMSEIKPDLTDYTYKIQGSVIYTSIESGTIEIAYQALSVDGDGYPVIPDNSSFTRALELYIKKQHFTILFDLGKIRGDILNQTLQDYAFAVGDCESSFNRMTLDKAEAFYNSWSTLIVRKSEHKHNFLHNGTQEKIKLK